MKYKILRTNGEGTEPTPPKGAFNLGYCLRWIAAQAPSIRWVYELRKV